MSRRFWLILVALAVVFIVIFKLESKKTPVVSSNAPPTQHLEGSSPVGVTLVEYGDYQCPFCEQYYPVVKQVAAQYSQQIVFQFRNLPLTQLHPNAFAAARAAEAASLQGKFWQMHDLLYDAQSNWASLGDPSATFVAYARQLGLNTTKFQQDFSGDQVNNSINADIAAFNKTGQQEATPSFFLDGKFVQPTATLDSFTKLINAELTKKAASNPTNGSNNSH